MDIFHTNFQRKTLGFPSDCSTLSCKIYRENERRKSKQNDIDLIGIIDIPLSTITGNQFIEQWYSLQQFNTKDKSNKFSDGSINIRIKAKYQPIQILPIHAYQSLQDVCHTFHLDQYIDSFYLSIFIKIIFP